MMKDQELLLQHVQNGNLEQVKLLIENSKSVHINKSRNQFGSPLVSLAAYYKHPEIVSYLLENGADITIRDNKSGLWRSLYDARTAITNANALDIAVFLDYIGIIKMLLVHAIQLNASAQVGLLHYLGDKNILLYAAHKFPSLMQALIETINKQTELSSKTQILSDFILSANNQDDDKLVAKYLVLFKTESTQELNVSLQYLNSIEFDESLNHFKTLSRNKMATDFIEALANAKAALILTGDTNVFNKNIVQAVNTALPLGEQPAWKLAIAYFLEKLSIIFPISKNQIKFFKESDIAQKLETLKMKLEIPIVEAVAVPSAPPAEERNASVNKF